MSSIKLFFVTGTFHGSHIYTYTEGSARRIFHRKYNGESIIHLSDTEGKVYQSSTKNQLFKHDLNELGW